MSAWQRLFALMARRDAAERQQAARSFCAALRERCLPRALRLRLLCDSQCARRIQRFCKQRMREFYAFRARVLELTRRNCARVFQRCLRVLMRAKKEWRALQGEWSAVLRAIEKTHALVTDLSQRNAPEVFSEVRSGIERNGSFVSHFTVENSLLNQLSARPKRACLQGFHPLARTNLELLERFLAQVRVPQYSLSLNQSFWALKRLFRQPTLQLRFELQRDSGLDYFEGIANQ